MVVKSGGEPTKVEGARKERHATKAVTVDGARAQVQLHQNSWIPYILIFTSSRYGIFYGDIEGSSQEESRNLRSTQLQRVVFLAALGTVIVSCYQRCPTGFRNGLA